MNGHLQTIGDFVKAAVDKWFGISEQKFAHSALKLLNDMVEELKRAKSTCEAIPYYEKRFQEMLKELESGIQADKNKPMCLAATGGGIITLVLTISGCTIGVALGGVFITSVVTVGAYAITSKIVQHLQEKGDDKWNKCGKKV